jgi:hypothetical protein
VKKERANPIKRIDPIATRPKVCFGDRTAMWLITHL